MRHYAAVLLDVDGTLVDSNDAHAHAWVTTLARHGVDVAFERVRRMIGMGGDRLVEQTTGWPRDARKTKRLQDECAKTFHADWLRYVTPVDKARELVLRLNREGYQIALASAAHEDELRSLLQIADIDDLIDARARPPRPEASKPDPAAIDVALSCVDVNRSRALMIGDTPYDVEAARAARVDMLGFTTGGYAATALAGAIAVYRGPAELLALWDDSPLGSLGLHGSARG